MPPGWKSSSGWRSSPQTARSAKGCRWPGWHRPATGSSCRLAGVTSWPARWLWPPAPRTCRRSLRLPARSPTGLPNTTPVTIAVPTSSPTGRCWWSAAPSPAARSPRTCGPAAGGWCWRPAPSVMQAAMPIIAPGRGLSLPALAGAGVTLAGRPVAVDGERVTFDDSVAANVAAGDAFAARARAMVDEIIRRGGLDAPPAEPDEHDVHVDLDPPAWLDLHAEEVGSVVWCTGFTGDFSWLDPALVELDGQPRHADGAGPVPGLWYLGLRWLVRCRSSLLFGFPDDAATIANAVRAHLAIGQGPVWTSD